MYFETKEARTRSLLVILVIVVAGFYVLQSLEGANTEAIKTVKLFYYNAAQDVTDDGEVACDVDAVSAVARVVTFQATSTEAYLYSVLNELLTTPLNPIEEMSGFVTVNIPDSIYIEHISLVDSVSNVTVSLRDEDTLNSCEKKLLESQIVRTFESLEGVSTTTLEVIYR